MRAVVLIERIEDEKMSHLVQELRVADKASNRFFLPGPRELFPRLVPSLCRCRRASFLLEVSLALLGLRAL